MRLPRDRHRERRHGYDPALHTVDGRIRTTGASTAAHVQRVGFMHSLGDSYEVLEPALVMLRVDKRKAGCARTPFPRL